MKCLSLKQPYAELLVSGKKTIKLRNWNTSFRGKFLVHASKNIDIERSEALGIDHNKLTRGAIIGSGSIFPNESTNNLLIQDIQNGHHM
jgi:ASCH domain-containing protein